MITVAYPDNDVCTVQGLFDQADCSRFIELAEAHGFCDAPISTGTGEQIARSIRNNQRAMIDDVASAADLWRRVGDYAPLIDDWQPIALNERLRFYRYDRLQQFRWHRDGAFQRPNGETSHVTFMVYLNDDFTGGETGFNDFRVWPATGLVLMFRHHLRHQGAPVIDGRKYVLRSDVMYRRS